MKHLVIAALFLASPALAAESKKESTPATMNETDWKKKLTPEQYRVLREKGTEPAFTGILHDNKEPGIYRCGGCGQIIFRSDEKFESGTGWPSFTKPVSPDAVVEHTDKSHGMVRTEVVCSKCGGHLGHVFEDGPAPTGRRYCINSCSLDFKGKDKSKP